MFTSYTIALFSHLLGVLLFVSGIVLAGAPFEIARRREDPHEIAVILGLARAGVAFVGAGAIILLGFGLWLVHLGRFGYGTSWVVAALALFAVALLLGAIGGQRPKRARLRAERLAAEGSAIDAELRRLLDDPFSRTVNYASALSVIGVLGLMVFKP